jgi:hypothetical protein
MTADVLYAKVATRVFTAFCCSIPATLFIKDNITGDANASCCWVQQPIRLHSNLIADENSGRAAVVELM